MEVRADRKEIGDVCAQSSSLFLLLKISSIRILVPYIFYLGLVKTGVCNACPRPAVAFRHAQSYVVFDETVCFCSLLLKIKVLVWLSTAYLCWSGHYRVIICHILVIIFYLVKNIWN